jgi:gas vesicle protein
MRYEKEESSASTKLTFLLIGGGIGAIIALLFAPKAGHELRGDIADATRKGIDKTKETAAQLQDKAGEYYEVSREKASELYLTAQEKAAELAETAKNKAGEITEKAKEAAASTANPFKAAIEAGKDAYYDEKRKTETVAITEGRPTYPKDGVLEIPKEAKK